jgi:oligopeptide transport system ATP-binding protein
MGGNMDNDQNIQPLLEVKNLKTYFPIYGGVLSRHQGYVHAVDDVSFTVHPEETLGIVGESGCGKTTLLQTIIRLVPATSGSIIFEEKDLLTLSATEMRTLRKDIQIVFQDPYGSLNPRMTIGEIIGEPLEIHTDMTKERIKSRVKDLLSCVGLETSYIDRHPHEFSGGQRQRISIARALALNPKLILCDEPLSALDVSIQSQIINLLSDLQNEFNLTYIFISHALNVVRHVSDKVAVMYLGKIVEIAPVDAIYNNPQHPYTKALLSAIPVPNPKFEHEKIRLEGEIPSPKNPPPGCRFSTRCPYATKECKEREPELREFAPDCFAACILKET